MLYEGQGPVGNSIERVQRLMQLKPPLGEGEGVRELESGQTGGDGAAFELSQVPEEGPCSRRARNAPVASSST